MARQLGRVGLRFGSLKAIRHGRMELPAPLGQKPPASGIEEQLMAKAPLAGGHSRLLCPGYHARFGELAEVAVSYAIAAQSEQQRLREAHPDDRGHLEGAPLSWWQGIDARPEQRPQAERHAAPDGAAFDPDLVSNLLELARVTESTHDLAYEEGVAGGSLM